MKNIGKKERFPILNRNDKYCLIMLVFLAIITHWFWFLESGPFTGGDWVYWFSETALEYFTVNFSWVTSGGMGRDLIGSEFYPQLLVGGLLARLFNFDMSQASAFLFYYPLIFIPYLSAYFLARHVSGSSLAAFIGAIAYSCNTYFIISHQTQCTVAMAYALTPLAVLWFIYTVDGISVTYSILTGIVMSILSQYEVRSAYIVSWVLVFYLFYNISLERTDILRKLAVTILSFSIIGFTNLYWLLPSLFAYSPSGQNFTFLYRPLFGDIYMNLRQAIFNFLPFWTAGNPANFAIHPIPMHLFLLPILAFVCMFSRKMDKKILFFAILVLIGVFFTKQSAHPFPTVYRWLYLHFPGFNAFREASKFYLLINLSYALLIGYSLNKLYRFTKHLKIKYIGEICVLLVIIMSLWNTYPMVTQKLTLSKSKTIPPEYIELKNHLLAQTTFFRTMGIPRVYRYTFYNTIHPALNASLITTELWKKPNFPVYDMNYLFKYPHLNWLFDTASIKYVYIPYDPDKEMFDYINDEGMLVKMYGGNRKELEKMLDHVNWLSNKKSFGEIIMYENRGTLPHIYASSSLK